MALPRNFVPDNLQIVYMKTSRPKRYTKSALTLKRNIVKMNKILKRKSHLIEMNLAICLFTFFDSYKNNI